MSVGNKRGGGYQGSPAGADALVSAAATPPRSAKKASKKTRPRRPSLASPPRPAPSRMPLYILASELALVAGWSQWRTINLLKQARIARKLGRVWATATCELRAVFPEVYQELVNLLERARGGVARAEDDDQGDDD